MNKQKQLSSSKITNRLEKKNAVEDDQGQDLTQSSDSDLSENSILSDGETTSIFDQTHYSQTDNELTINAPNETEKLKTTGHANANVQGNLPDGYTLQSKENSNSSRTLSIHGSTGKANKLDFNGSFKVSSEIGIANDIQARNVEARSTIDSSSETPTRISTLDDTTIHDTVGSNTHIHSGGQIKAGDIKPYSQLTSEDQIVAKDLKSGVTLKACHSVSANHADNNVHIEANKIKLKKTGEHSALVGKGRQSKIKINGTVGAKSTCNADTIACRSLGEYCQINTAHLFLVEKEPISCEIKAEIKTYITEAQLDAALESQTAQSSSSLSKDQSQHSLLSSNTPLSSPQAGTHSDHFSDSNQSQLNSGQSNSTEKPVLSNRLNENHFTIPTNDTKTETTGVSNQDKNAGESINKKGILSHYINNFFNSETTKKQADQNNKPTHANEKEDASALCNMNFNHF